MSGDHLTDIVSRGSALSACARESGKTRKPRSRRPSLSRNVEKAKVSLGSERPSTLPLKYSTHVSKGETLGLSNARTFVLRRLLFVRYRRNFYSNTCIRAEITFRRPDLLRYDAVITSDCS